MVEQPAIKPKGLIVIDGPDGQGKTLLAKTIAEKVGGVYQHLSCVKEDMFEYQAAHLANAVAMADHRVVVLDRLWQSEQIYARVYRSGSVMHTAARGFDRILQKHGALQIVTLSDDIKLMLERFNGLRETRSEMYDKGMDKVIWAYHEMVNGASVYEIDPDYFNPDYCQHFALRGGFKLREDCWVYDMDEWYCDVQSAAAYALERLEHSRNLQMYSVALTKDAWNVAGSMRDAKIVFVVPNTLGAKSDLQNQILSALWPAFREDDLIKTINETLAYLCFDENLAMWTAHNLDDGHDHVAELIGRGCIPISFGAGASKRVIAALAKNDMDTWPHFSIPAYKANTPRFCQRLKEAIISAVKEH